MTKSFQGEGEAYFPAPWWSHFATSHQDEAEDEAGGEEEEEEDTEESSEESETEMGQEEEGVEDLEEEEVEPEFQLTEDTEDERFKADTLFIIEEVLSRVSSEQRVDEEEVVGEGVECPVEVGRVEETAGEDAGGGVGWQEVEEDEVEEDEVDENEVEEDEVTKTKTDAERSAESPADASVEEEESPDEGISSDTSCSEEGVVNEEEEEGGPVVEEELSEKSEGFFEAIESRGEEYAKLGVVNGLDTKNRCLTDEDFGESENAAKIANEDTFSA